MLLWLYRFDVKRRLCCSGSICLAWRGGRAALALPDLMSRGGRVALALLVLMSRGGRVALALPVLTSRGGRVALALSVWRRLEAA